MKKILFILLSAVSMNIKAQNLTINYQRVNDDYDGWKLWVWDKTENKNGFEINPATKTDFGIKFVLDLNKNNLLNKEIGILPKYGNWEKKESFDRILNHSGENEIFILEGDPKIYKSLKEIDISTQITGAYYDGEGKIRITLNRRVLTERLKDFYLTGKDTKKKIPLKKDSNSKLSSFVNFKTEKDIPLEDIRKGKYEVIGDFGKSLLVFGNAIYALKPSDEKLGEVYEDGKIKLKVFSTAKELNLIIKKEDKDVKMPFEYKNNFIWEVSLSTDYYGSYYKYEAVYPDKKLYGIDPHAALTYDNNKWAIFHKDDTQVADGPKIDLSDIIIYEMSVRDFTIDKLSGIKNKGKYLGISEDNSTHQNFKEIKTGISHLKELGVNAVHIMPFYDFEKEENTEDYDWGYMPVSYNSPEGWFSVDKKEKISETKKMIDSLHKNGIKVIMDVVYNHTAETGGKAYNFQTSAYDYFYRKKDDGSYYNGSGCGNEFKSDSPYGRKFIIDSLKYWTKEYKIDGFRFDLMGLIDLETVDELIKELKKIKPD
ncbi:MAG: pullulanase-associated domain-containing protein, partial [Elusimicrobiota bacterium]